MNIHYFQHVPFEGPACIEDWAVANGHKLSSTQFYATHQLPDLEKIDVLIVLGGPMGVYDEQRYEWLANEKSFIKKAIQSGKKVLGICLGAQLIADCAGAKVEKAPHKEIGWFKVKATQHAQKVPWLYELLKDGPTVFHWHGDKFQIPEGSENLGISDANDNQCFMVGDKVLGLQFHFEINENSLRQMLKHGKSELIASDFVQSAEPLLVGRSFIKENNNRMFSLLDNFLRDEKLFALVKTLKVKS